MTEQAQERAPVVNDNDLPVANLKYIAARDLRRDDVWLQWGEYRIDRVTVFPTTVQYRVGRTLYVVPENRGMWVLRNET